VIKLIFQNNKHIYLVYSNSSMLTYVLTTICLKTIETIFLHKTMFLLDETVLDK